ncbi:pentalenene synthase [Magnaporthiopsis poae ATCC 64411]|uniref:Terpene synthase n=1 Tax=Magnaporthiopsis poae (strain ATCC 64411 / 73-15) TaxID=644358 RepID=A0A0C4E438_MAGP6|nr:pentalenene synthase [Magnaporthiopsis poae ATCC 64411]
MAVVENFAPQIVFLPDIDEPFQDHHALIPRTPVPTTFNTNALLSLPVVDEGADLVRKYTGETVHVPNLVDLMPAWPNKTHSQDVLDEVTAEIDEWLKTVNIPQAKRPENDVAQRYTTLASVFYTDCSKRKLVTLTKYQCWNAWFGEEMDHPTHDAAATRRLCDQTLQCVDACLGSSKSSSSLGLPSSAASRAPPSGTVAVLQEVLTAMRAEMATASAERLRRELRDSVETAAKRQAARRHDTLPDPWHHLDVRCDDVGALPNITATEYAMGFGLPGPVRYHEAVETVVLECTRLATLVHEVLSCQKDFRDGKLNNMCLLLANAENISVKAAVAKVLGLVRKHYEACEAAEPRLPWAENDKHLNDQIREYVSGCKRLATGTTHWAYLCGPYFDKAKLGDDWNLSFTLEQ